MSISLRIGLPGQGMTEGAQAVLVQLADRCLAAVRVADYCAQIGDLEVRTFALEEAEASSVAAFEVARYYS